MMALRPESIRLGKAAPNSNQMQAVVENVSFLGSIVRIRVRTGDHVISLDTFNQPHAAPPKIGEAVAISFSPDDLVVLDAAGAA